MGADVNLDLDWWGGTNTPDTYGSSDYNYDYSYDTSSNNLNLYQDWWGGTSPGSTGATFSAPSAAPGGSGANTGGANWWDSVSSWLTEGTGPGKKGPSILSMAMPAAVQFGLGTLSEAFTGRQKKKMKLEEQQTDAITMNAQANAARVAQTSHGSAIPKIKKPAGGLMYHQVAVNRPKVQGVA